MLNRIKVRSLQVIGLCVGADFKRSISFGDLNQGRTSTTIPPYQLPTTISLVRRMPACLVARLRYLDYATPLRRPRGTFDRYRVKRLSFSTITCLRSDRGPVNLRLLDNRDDSLGTTDTRVLLSERWTPTMVEWPHQGKEGPSVFGMSWLTGAA